jgi:hypothetical protein
MPKLLLPPLVFLEESIKMNGRLPEKNDERKIVDDYLRYLYNTLILLGSDVRFATLLMNPEIITQTDIAELRQYNLDLTAAIKDRLSNINSIRVIADKSERQAH